METVNFKEDYFINPEGIKLFRLIYPSIIEPLKAVVFVCHGLFEHCQAAYYETVIKHLTNIGCMVITHDHQGHGLSGGQRGMIFNFEYLVRDVILDIEDARKCNEISENIPVFIYGHSMGGLVAVCTVLRQPQIFKGMCLEAPLLSVPSNIGKITIAFGKMISRICPSFPMAKLKDEDICSNVDYINRLKQDPLRIHAGVPVKTAIELLDAVDLAKPYFKDITTPFIIGHGEVDKLCDIGGSRTLMELCPIEDKTLITFLNARHQLRMELENVDIEFRQAIVDWIQKKIAS